MTPQELNAIKDLTKSVNGLVGELKKMNRAGITRPAEPITMPGDEPVAMPEEPKHHVKVPAYAPSFSESPYDERISNGFATIGDQGINVTIPTHLYTEKTREIVEKGEPLGVAVTILHRNPIR